MEYASKPCSWPFLPASFVCCNYFFCICCVQVLSHCVIVSRACTTKTALWDIWRCSSGRTTPAARHDIPTLDHQEGIHRNYHGVHLYESWARTFVVFVAMPVSNTATPSASKGDNFRWRLRLAISNLDERITIVRLLRKVHGRPRCPLHLHIFPNAQAYFLQKRRF